MVKLYYHWRDSLPLRILWTSADREQVQGGHEEVGTSGPVSGLQPGERLQQLLKERDDLRQLLNEQLETTSVHTARINGLEDNLLDMQNATKLASQVSHQVLLHAHLP